MIHQFNITTMRKTNTKNLIVTDYVKMRDYVCDEILNNAKTVYPNDKEILLGVVDLVVYLKTSDPDARFVQDLKGFMMWAKMTNQDARHALTTLIHDLGEFMRNRHQEWFCPRSYGYAKYLTGAAGVA